MANPPAVMALALINGKARDELNALTGILVVIVATATTHSVATLTDRRCAMSSSARLDALSGPELFKPEEPVAEESRWGQADESSCGASDSSAQLTPAVLLRYASLDAPSSISSVLHHYHDYFANQIL
jgi:hypothetical protein